MNALVMVNMRFSNAGTVTEAEKEKEKNMMMKSKNWHKESTD
jgi:hypothetical protein